LLVLDAHGEHLLRDAKSTQTTADYARIDLNAQHDVYNIGTLNIAQ
jgi:hypothetical protein